jgi:hypothetical protein
MAEHEYGVEEANELIPEATQALEEIRRDRQIILAGGERLGRVATLDGGGEVGKEYWDALSGLRRRLEWLNERDIVLRDPETGQIAFPSQRDGEPVFLCWRMGEDRVGFWHGPESGFAGRRPL